MSVGRIVYSIKAEVKDLEDCLFCKIAEKKIPAEVVYEDDTVLAFHDINPVAPIHILLISKKHIASLGKIEDSDKDLLGQLLLTASKIAADLGFSEKGFRLINNCGKDSGQIIDHLHFHLIAGKNLGSQIV